jgi:uncharacterized cupredoxin-like copper-binding protein
MLKRGLNFVLGCLILWMLGLGGGMRGPIAQAATAPSQQQLVDMRVHLGTTANELKFEPNQLTFEAGKRYKLILDNPSNLKHYFTAKDFADVSWTQKVEAGNVEVKGAIHELELKPGALAEWVFIPLKPGTYELHCSVPGHAEAGMTGTIDVS